MEKIKFENFMFRYPLCEQYTLKNINFAVNQAEFFVICGQSGCGKSTLLRNIKKNMAPYGEKKGKILYDGKEIGLMDNRENASKIGFVLQNPDNQIVTDKVWHELAFGLENLGTSIKKIKRQVAEMATYFGIQNWFQKDTVVLSGGQKQLLNLASILAMQPEVVILDEPLSQLDPIATTEFIQTIYKINRDLGITIILSEHRLEEILPIADRVLVMEKGEIVGLESPNRIGEKLVYGIGREGKHPMYYGLPSVVRILQPICKNNEAVPLTVRDGRIKIDQMIAEGKLKTDRSSLIEVKKQDIQKNKEYIIEMKNIWFRYERESQDIIKGLSLKVEQGKWYCLLGGNGSGKSTTLKLICGILKPQNGKVIVNGVNVNNNKANKELFKSCLALLPQNPQSLFTEITVEEELYESMVLMELSEEERIKEVEYMLDLMEITHLRKTNPYDLSGGEQQRLAMGKILLLKPKVLLLDEPTKGLDPFFKRTLAKIIRKLKDEGVTIFMVSHDIEFCASYADYCSMFFDGEIVSEETAKDFFSGNNFYTTATNKIIRQWEPNIVTCEEAQLWLKKIKS